MSDIVDTFTPQDALIALMVALSASDESVRTSELITIERIVNHLPVFRAYDQLRIRDVSNLVFDLLTEEDGLDTLFTLVRKTLPETLWETAYALCCDVAAADGKARDGELRLLEEMRYELNIDRLHSAAIERAARVRHLVV